MVVVVVLGVTYKAQMSGLFDGIYVKQGALMIACSEHVFSLFFSYFAVCSSAGCQNKAHFTALSNPYRRVLLAQSIME